MHVTAVFLFLFALAQVREQWPTRWEVALAYAAIPTFGLYLVVLTHELGHALTARQWWNIPTDGITLSVLGGVAHMSHPAPSPKAEIGISLAGPMTHGLWLAAAWPGSE